MIETPPNDAARPVRWIVDNCLFYDEESANAFSESLLGSPTCNPTVFPVYTAADYDALRAEVERLNNELRVTDQHLADCMGDLNGLADRAEAAEYRIAGPKPWGGGTTQRRFSISIDELKQAIAGYEGKRK